ncbi:MAG TPA: hypothetical protein VFN22_03605 [Gemmatimonadales bacterium]|nr:hypothetical protein [Gemmatimonadales bacterium]
MTLRETLDSVARPVRRARAVRRALPWLLAGIMALGLAAWAGRLGVAWLAVWALLAWLAVSIGMLGAAIQWARAHTRLDEDVVAAHLEGTGHWRRGALSMLLQPVAAGTSSELHAAADALQQKRVLAEAPAVLVSEWSRDRRATRRMLVGGLAAVGFLALARPVSGTRGALMTPWSAWRALMAPVQLTTSTPVVDRGERAVLELVVFGQRRARLLLRAPGESWREQDVSLDDAGRATITTEPMEGDLVARLEAGGRRSAELRVTMRTAAFLGGITLTADYPAYLGIESEPLPVEGDTLVIPEGTRLRLAARSTSPLRTATLRSDRDTIALDVEALVLGGAFQPRRDATWRLDVTTRDGAPLDGVPPPLPIRVVPDSVPTVTIPVPGADTIAPPSHRLAVVIAIEDDHGIGDGALEVRKGGGGIVRQPLELGGATDRALLTTSIDLDALGAAAGDTVRYAAVASDKAPRRGVGRSRTFMVVIPTAAEERRTRMAATDETGSALDSLVEAARRAQRSAEDLARERQRAGSAGSNAGSGAPMPADAARRAEQAAKAAEAVAQRLDQMRADVAELEQAAARAAPSDSTLTNDLREIRALLDRAMTPELREAMDRLQESVRTLDPDATRDALRDVAAEQAKMREALERARELFERAALETTLSTLAEEAGDLSAAQERAKDALAVDSAAGAQAEASLADRADSLASGLDAAAERAPGETTQRGLRDAASQSRQAAAQMRAAGQSAGQGKRQQAQREAESAGELMEPVSDEITKQRESMQEAMREEVLADLRRLLAETTRVLSRQYTVAESFRRGALVGPLRAEEAMLEEATAKLLRQVITVAGKNALISPTVSVAFAGARDGLRGALDASSAAAPSLGLAADRAGDAVDMLSLAAYALLQSQRNVEGSESGSGLQEAMQQMMQMAGQQNAAAQQGQSMQQQGAQPGMGELMQLAMQQRAIAQQLERMRAQGQMPGAGELAREAHDVARQIESGRLSTEVTERQKTLFRRMLDAGRSLDGDQDEQSSERQSESAKTSTGTRPPALDPRITDRDAIRLPGWDELQRLDPDDRRRVLDYFRRLTEVRQP